MAKEEKLVRVKMNTIYASARGQCHPGGHISLPESEVADLVKGKYADLAPFPAEGDKADVKLRPAEHAVNQERETATAVPGKEGGKGGTK